MTSQEICIDTTLHTNTLVIYALVVIVISVIVCGIVGYYKPKWIMNKEKDDDSIDTMKFGCFSLVCVVVMVALVYLYHCHK